MFRLGRRTSTLSLLCLLSFAALIFCGINSTFSSCDSVSANVAASENGDVSICSQDTKTIPFTGEAGTKNERTFIALKPDAVQRGLIGEIIKRFEGKGYKLVAMKMEQVTEKKAKEHYDDLKTQGFFNDLIAYFTSSPVVAMVWEGSNVVAGGRKLMGATVPDKADPGTIRFDLAINVGRNLIHGSDSTESAKREIALWFKPEEVVQYTLSTSKFLSEKY